MSLPLLLAACSGGSSDCEGESCASPDGGQSSIDAGPDQPDAAMPTKTALINIELEPPLFQGEQGRTLINGAFHKTADPCASTVVESCVVRDCPQAIGGTLAGPGKLTFSPALGGNISFDPGPFPLFFTADIIPWAASEEIHISNLGEDVPPFSVAVASPRTLDIGEGREQFNLPLPKNQKLHATWVSLPEQVLLQLRQGRDTANGEYEVIVECVVGGAFGNGDIPAAALSHLIPKASGGLSATLDTFAIREKTTVAGEYAVTARVLRSFGLTLFYDVQ